MWDPRFSRAYRQPPTHFWSLLECAVHGRSSQCGTRGFLGLTANPHTLGPSWSVRRHGRSKQCRTRGFSGLTANPQHTFGPSWSVRRHGRSSSVGPAVSRANRQPLTDFGPSWSVRLHGRSSQCGTRGFSGLTANPHTLGPSWSVRLLAAPRSVGPSVFLGSPPTHNTLGPSWSVRLLAAPPVWDPRFTRAHRQPSTFERLEHQTSAVDVSLNQGFVPRPYPRWGNGRSHAQLEKNLTSLHL